MAKQVKFLDLENNAEMGGIELDSGDIICCCCGGLFEKSKEGILWKKLNEYRIWADLSPKICIENESDRFKRFEKGTIHHISNQKNEGEKEMNEEKTIVKRNHDMANSRQALIAQVKALGQDVIDRAEDLVGDYDMTTGFDIWLRFPKGEIPEIELTRTYYSKNLLDIYHKELFGGD